MAAVAIDDIEKHPDIKSEEDFLSASSEDQAGHATELKTAKNLSFINNIAVMFKAEIKGVELVSDEEKTDNDHWNTASMWLSANLVIATISLGALGTTLFALSFWQAFITIIFFSLIGASPVAFFSIFGPKLGLRQIFLSKYLVGDWAMRIFAFINMVACIGWGAVNIMASAQLLHIVNNGALPPWAGCLILIVLTILVTFFGYHVIHLYEKWSWVPNAIIFIILIARLCATRQFVAGGFPGGEVTAGNVLSFGGAVYGFATGWTTYASDYTVYRPRDVNSTKIFFYILGSLWPTLILGLTLGAACGASTGTKAAPTRLGVLYNEESIGGLVYGILVEDSLHGFGQFCCVVLALSTVANNIPNMYSIALSAQALASPLVKVPRVFWTVAGNFITLAICIPAYYNFESAMDNFMNLIGYYLAIYQCMSLSEHFIYNRADFTKYDYLNSEDKSKYPMGIAGVFGFCCGVAGAVIGMNQTWYQGPIASLIGKGGDIGFELAFGFSFVGFNLVRPFEKKYIGR